MILYFKGSIKDITNVFEHFHFAIKTHVFTVKQYQFLQNIHWQFVMQCFETKLK